MRAITLALLLIISANTFAGGETCTTSLDGGTTWCSESWY